MSGRDRIHVRVKRRLALQIRTRDGSTFAAFTGDVSHSGLYVSCRKTPAAHEILEILARLPDGSSVLLRGVSMWARPAPTHLLKVLHGGFGVRLVDVPEQWRQWCTQFASKSPLAA